MKTKLEFHEISNIFPLMSGQDYINLRDDIKEHGLLEPIILYEGKILDGRNRYAACLDLGIEPQFENLKNVQSLLSYVLSKNLHRRHLNETQRAIVASKIANMKIGGDGSNQYQSKSANLPNCSENINQPQAAEMLNVSERTLRSVKAVEREAPELLPRMETGEMSIGAAEKEVKKRKKEKARNQLAQLAKEIPPNERWSVTTADIKTYKTEKKYDFIITDPPYPKEYLELYEILAIRSKEWLKPSGLLVAMCGQSYLNQIYEMLSRHLIYYWTAAYLLPGQPTPLRQRQVNTCWKPLLIFSLNEHYQGKTFSDVFISNASEKDFHEWGQSVSGMLSIISQICLPGQTIFDPFCGAGTTGIAAIKHGCLFDGIDIDEQNVNVSKGRLHDASET